MCMLTTQHFFSNTCKPHEKPWFSDVFRGIKREHRKRKGLKALNSFSKFYGLCPNITKYKIAGIGVLRSVTVTLRYDMLNFSIECI